MTDLTDGQEVTTDEESGLTVSEVMDQAENEGIDLYEMEPGETVTFMAAAGNARSSQQVSVTRGAESDGRNFRRCDHRDCIRESSG